VSETKITLPESAIPAPEAANAVHGVVEAVARSDEEGREGTILFNLSGHGHFDLGAYDAYLHGELADFELPEAEIARALAAIEQLPKPAGVATS
jgi:tryptophan synthase beta chain